MGRRRGSPYAYVRLRRFIDQDPCDEPASATRAPRNRTHNGRKRPPKKRGAFDGRHEPNGPRVDVRRPKGSTEQDALWTGSVVRRIPGLHVRGARALGVEAHVMSSVMPMPPCSWMAALATCTNALETPRSSAPWRATRARRARRARPPCLVRAAGGCSDRAASRPRAHLRAQPARSAWRRGFGGCWRGPA